MASTKSLEETLAGMYRAVPVNNQLFDRMELDTVPRYKTSGASGSEWRFSTRVRFYKKGILIKESFGGSNSLETLLSIEEHKPTHYTKEQLEQLLKLCQQEGCCEPARNYYKLKERWCEHCGEKSTHKQAARYRTFCAAHSTRGDCGLEDCDSNYELIYGDGVASVPPEAVSQSASIYVSAETMIPIMQSLAKN